MCRHVDKNGQDHYQSTSESECYGRVNLDHDSICVSWRSFIISTLLLFFCCTSVYADDDKIIHDYHQIWLICYDQYHKPNIAIRQYSVNDATTEFYFLLVDPFTFVTRSVPAKSVICHADVTDTPELQKMPYLRALAKYSAPPYKWQGYGMKEADHSNAINGVFLTVDLCPSSKPFEKAFFQILVTMVDNSKHAIPLAIGIAGNWMLKHQKEMEWLIAQEKANKLQIIWLNHTFSHVYRRGVPFDENYLQTLESDFDHEILDVEKILLEKGETPSVFFRFPGLLADKKLILKLHTFGLIPVGANAWLAKGEAAKNGSIILVHGNSNEPFGIREFISGLQNQQFHQFDLLPLTLAPSVGF